MNAPVDIAPVEEIRPLPGPQTMLLSCSADVCIYGGGAGGGKTRGLLMDPLHYVHIPGFRGVIFRRTCPDITAPGSLRDDALNLYPETGAEPNDDGMRWTWPSGAWLKFSHMQLVKDVLRWKGSQLAFIGWDELTDFDRQQFFYMLSRLRSMCGVNPYVRATCNPDPDSWVHDLVRWWLDEEGYPDPDKAGVIRWFAMDGDTMVWSDSKEELEAFGHDPLSFTFIPALLADNPILTKTDPSYLKKLKALPHYERATLLGGCWNVRLTAGMVFNEDWFEVLNPKDIPPYHWANPDNEEVYFDRVIRYWDRAASEPTPAYPNPDWTVGVKVGRTTDRQYIVLDVKRERHRPRGVRNLIKKTAEEDGEEVEQWLEEDPGQAGKQDIDALTSLLAGYVVRVNRVTLAKAVRARTASAQAENGHVKVVKAVWNKPFLSELNGFVDEKKVKPPPGYKDDQVDGLTGAMNELYENNEISMEEL